MVSISKLTTWARDIWYFWTVEERPTYDDVGDAHEGAALICSSLFCFVRATEDLFPEHASEIADLVDKIKQKIRDEHGGYLPCEMLSDLEKRYRKMAFKDLFMTPEQKETMIQIVDRWKDTEQVQQEFWGSKGYFTGEPLTEELFFNRRRSLQNWLDKHRANRQYY